MKKKTIILLLFLTLLWGGGSLVNSNVAEAGFFDWVGTFFKSSGRDNTGGLVGHWMLDEDHETLGTELITNNGFETDTSNWTANGTPVTFERNTTTPIAGTGDAHFVGNASAYSAMIADGISFVTGKRYRISFTYKRVGSNLVYVKIGTTAVVAAAGLGGFSDVNLTATSNTDYSLDFTPTETSTGYVMFRDDSATSGEMYVDSISVKELQTLDLSSSGNDGSLYQDATVYATDRYETANEAMEFDGTGDYVSIADDTSLDVTNITISAWVNPDTLAQTDGAAILCKGDGAGGEVYCLDMSDAGANKKPRLYFYESAEATIASSSVEIPADQWSHVSGTFDGSTLTIYINGISRGTASKTASLDTNNHALTIGCRQSGSTTYDYCFDGKLQDVRVYSKALSVWEIKKIYEETIPDKSLTLKDGLVSRWTLSQLEETTSTNKITNEDFETNISNWTDYGTLVTFERNTTSPISGTGDAHFVGNASASSAMIADGISFVTGKRYRISLTYRRVGSTPVYVKIGQTASTGAANIGGVDISLTETSNTDYSLDFTSDVTATGYVMFRESTDSGEMYVDDVVVQEIFAGDTTDNANHGSWMNTPTYATDHNSVSNNAMDFEASSDQYINCGDSVSELTFGTGDHSYTAWIKPEYFNGNGYNYVVATGTNTSSAQSGFGTYDNGTEVTLFNSAYSSPLIYSEVSAGKMSVDTWSHIAMVHEGANTSFYIDGEFQDSIAIALNTTTGKCRIGINVGNGTTSDFDGVIEDVRIYNRALTAREIKDIYSPPTTKNLTLADGLVGRWTLADRDGVVTGSELVTNGTIEEGGGNWANVLTPQNNALNTVFVHSGTYSRIFTPNEANEGIQSDAFTTTTGKRYKVSAWVYPFSGTAVTVTIRKGDDSGDIYDTSQTGLTQFSWNEISIHYTETAGGAGAYIIFDSGVSTSGTWYIDDVSIKEVQATDVSGSGNSGTITGVSPTTDHNSVADSAFTFDGSTGEIISSTYDNPTDFSVSAWVKSVNWSQSETILGKRANFSVGTIGWSCYSSAGNLYCIVDNDTASKGGYDAGLTNDQWYHIVLTYEEDVIAKLYVDGSSSVTQHSEALTSFGSIVSPSDFTIGASGESGSHLDGSVSDVRIWNRVLTPWEVSKLYNES